MTFQPIKTEEGTFSPTVTEEFKPVGGIGQAQKEEIFSGGFLSDVFDVLSIPQYAATGLISGESIVKGIKYRAVPSEKLNLTGWKGFIADVLLDPINFLGAGVVLKGFKAMKEGKEALTFAEAVARGEKALIRIGIPGTEAKTSLMKILGLGGVEKQIAKGITKGTEAVKRIPVPGLEKNFGEVFSKAFGGVKAAPPGTSLKGLEEFKVKQVGAQNILKAGERAVATGNANAITKVRPLLEKMSKAIKKGATNVDEGVKILGKLTKATGYEQVKLSKVGTEIFNEIKKLSDDASIRWDIAGGPTLVGKEMPNILLKEYRDKLGKELDAFTGARKLGTELSSEKWSKFFRVAGDNGVGEIVESVGKKTTIAKSLDGIRTYKKLGNVWLEDNIFKKVMKAKKELEEQSIFNKVSRSRKAAGKLKEENMARELEDLLKGVGLNREAVAGIDINKALVAVGRQAIFEEDPFKAIFKKLSVTSQLEARNKYAKMAEAKFGRTLAKGEAIPKGFASVKIPGLENVVFEKDVAEILGSTYKKFTNIESIGDFAKIYDSILNFWKGTATFINVAFHVRNAVSNLWQMFLADALNPKDVFIGWNTMRKVAKARRAGKIPNEMKKLLGKEYDTFTKFVDEGLGGTGQFFTDIDRGLKRKNWAFEWGGELGNFVEDSSKYSMFRTLLKKGYSKEAAGMKVRKYLFDYGDLTDFERNIMKRAAPFYCVPESTEILTKKGWKTHKELIVGEKVLTYVDDKLEWQPVEDVAIFDFDGDLMSISNKRTSLLATDDHRWAIKDYKGKNKIVRGYELNSGHKIPLTGEYQSDESILSVRDAAILGWLVTDGYYRWRGESMEAVLFQHPHKYVKEIRELLGEDCSSEWSHPNGTITFRIKVKAMENIREHFSGKKDLMSIVTRLSTEAMKAMRDAMFMADGCICKSHRYRFFSQAKTDPEVRDTFQFLSQMLGEPINLKKRGGYIKKNKFFWIKSCKIRNQHYKGIIWCPKTPNGTWLMRQNGAVVVSGNTWSKKNIPLQVAMLIQDPSKFAVIPKFKRAVESTATGEPMDERLIPEWLREGYSIFMGENPNGMAGYFRLEGFLPAIDLTKIQHPGEALVDQMTPLFKTPLEMFSNYDFFYENQIKQFEGQQKGLLGMEVSPYIRKLADLFRPLKEFERISGLDESVQKKGTELSERVMRLLSGVNIQRYDAKKQEDIYEMLLDREISTLKKEQKKARKEGNQDRADDYGELIKLLKGGETEIKL